MDEHLQRKYIGFKPPTEKMAASKVEQRQLLIAQLLSMGFNLDDDPDMQSWSNAELQEILDMIVTTSSGDAAEGGEEKLIVTASRTIAASNAVSEKAKTTIPEVPTERHIPGVNDLMSGALPLATPQNPPRTPTPPSQNSTTTPPSP